MLRIFFISFFKIVVFLYKAKKIFHFHYKSSKIELSMRVRIESSILAVIYSGINLKVRNILRLRFDYSQILNEGCLESLD